LELCSNYAYYELAAFSELKNKVRSGDISIVGSRQHRTFEDYLLSPDEWESLKSKTSFNVPLDGEAYINQRKSDLEKRISWLSNSIKSSENVRIDDNKVYVSKLEKSTPDEAKVFSSDIYNIFPKVNLTNLLMEVSSWTKFEKHFVHISTEKEPREEDKIPIMATLMSMGTNIGFTKMAQATSQVTYRQMANIANWRMYDDAMNKAQAALVNFHHKQLLSKTWGYGTTSSSDGMRVQIGVSALNARHNPHYGSGKGTTIYRFTSDQYSTFHTKIINTNSKY